VATSAIVRRNAYVDSVTLLQVSADVLSLPGVLDAALVMATDLNRQILSDSGLLVAESETAGPNDLVVAVRAADEAAAASALAQAERLVSSRRRAPEQSAAARPRSVRAAHRADPDARLALISVPGAFAAGEARQALADGLHVFLFSDNVSLADEVDLKQRAHDSGLLVMGPDCGTAILAGTGFGFANVVRRGRIGLIGASGSGLQEVACLLHAAGEGISHAIGTGSRDLWAAVGGITTLQAIDMLRDDAATDTIVLVSKPSDPGVAQRVLRAAADTRKRVVACFLGVDLQPLPGVEVARNLHEAARLAASPEATWPEPVRVPRLVPGDGRRQVRGLFCGGTLCQEALAAMAEPGIHQCVDFGEDQYTRGRAHPMIDPTLRNHAIVEAGADPRVGVVLLDVILGLGSHTDPAGAALPAIREAQARAAADGRQMAVIAHVVGTDLDPQNLARQQATLRSAGVHVLGSNHEAAVAASLLLEGAVA
jgi:succinyl-CoA synthetase alpha subunit